MSSPPIAFEAERPCLAAAGISDAEPIYLGFIAEAKRRSLNIVGQAEYEFASPSYAPEAREILAARPDVLLLLAPYYVDGAKVVNAVRKGGYRGPILTSTHIVDDAMINTAPRALEGAYLTSTRSPLAALSADAREFVASIGAQEHALDALYGAETTNVVLDAIAASDGTRPGVRQALFRVSRDGVVGRIAFDGNGDVVPQRIAVYRMRSGQLRYRETITLRPG